MDVKIILYAQIFGVLIKITSSQYYGNPYQQSYPQQSYPQQSYPQQSYPQQPYAQQSYPQQTYYPQSQMQQPIQTPIQLHMPQQAPASEPSRRQHRDKPHLRSRYNDYSTDYEDGSNSDKKGSFRRGSGEFPLTDDYDEENVSGPINRASAPQTMPLPLPAVQPNLVLVPYPYALIVPTSSPTPLREHQPMPVAQTIPTHKPIQTTPDHPPDRPPNPPMDKPIYPMGPSESNPQMPPNRRLRLDEPGIRYRARKTKPTWLPKYGIVPIPDKLAEKLMSQLREVKGLQALRANRENNNGYRVDNAYGSQISSYA